MFEDEHLLEGGRCGSASHCETLSIAVASLSHQIILSQPPIAFTCSISLSAVFPLRTSPPVHEKELLAVIRAIKKWRYELIGTPFFVYTDHKTLLNFGTQKDLSRRQARWMEDLSVYDCKFVYVKGEDNTMRSALSRYPSTRTTCNIIAQHNAQHPHIEFNENAIVVLDRTLPTSTPLTSIAALTETNPQKTKV